jgi:hypothetical protein
MTSLAAYWATTTPFPIGAWWLGRVGWRTRVLRGGPYSLNRLGRRRLNSQACLAVYSRAVNLKRSPAAGFVSFNTLPKLS